MVRLGQFMKEFLGKFLSYGLMVQFFFPHFIGKV